MRQERIISYQELEARIKYLEEQISLYCEFMHENRGSIEKLNQFLTQDDTHAPSDEPEA